MTTDEKLDCILQHVEKLDNIILHMDQKFGQIDARFEQIDARFEQIDARFEQIDKEIKELKFMDAAILDELERVHHILIDHIKNPKAHCA